MVVKRFMKTNKVLLSFIGSALLLSGQASAYDIQPPVDNGSAMISRDEAAQSVGVSLTQNGWNDTKALREAYGQIAVDEARQKAGGTTFGRYNPHDDKRQGTLAANSILASDEAALKGAASDLAAMTVRMRIRQSMLPYWTKKRQELTKALTNGRLTSVPFSPALQKAYDRAASKREKLFRLYNGENNPDYMAPFIKDGTQAAEDLYTAACLDAERFAGGAGDAERQSLCEAYGRNVVLSLDDELQVKILKDRLLQQQKGYDQCLDWYEEDLKKYGNPGPSAMLDDAARQSQRDAILSQMEKLAPSKWEELGKLRAEYGAELYAMGYFDQEAARDQSILAVKPPLPKAKRLNIDGEFRVDSANHSGNNDVPDRARARLRVYGDYALNDNWHLIGMLENEKILTGRGDDNWMDLDRLYLSGNLGLVHADLGAFGSFLAEGNVYDSKFKGLRLSGDKPFSYMAEAGTIDDAGFVAAGEAYKDYGQYTYGLGLYSFDLDYAQRRNIFMANVRHPLGIFDVGAMGLFGADDDTSKAGYVLSLSKGEERSWEKGNKYWFLKYYHQPYTTYVSHTMNGLADYLYGFRGWGTGYYYTLMPNLVLQLEYYRLHALDSDKSGNTFWAALSYYFSNHN